MVPTFAAQEDVRKYVRVIQRQLCEDSRQGFIAEGRDMTYALFPDSEYKFFVTADILVRAKRYNFAQSGLSNISYLEALELLAKRDIMDLSRSSYPLKPALAGVKVFDTSLLEKGHMVNAFLRALNEY